MILGIKFQGYSNLHWGAYLSYGMGVPQHLHVIYIYLTFIGMGKVRRCKKYNQH